MEVLKIPREELFITSKLWNSFHSDVETGLKLSLTALGLDYLDLYLIHWPHAFKGGKGAWPIKRDGIIDYDFDTHPTMTWLAMEKLVDKGLVKSIGVSNFNSKQIQDILDKGTVSFLRLNLVMDISYNIGLFRLFLQPIKSNVIHILIRTNLKGFLKRTT